MDVCFVTSRSKTMKSLRWQASGVGLMVRGQRKGRRARLTQRGEAEFRRKPRLSDKTAERVALGLLGPAPRVAVG